MAKVWTRIRQTIERHGSAALLSVVGAAGSVPRESGARIVLQPDGGFFGTIGGGRLEYEAIAAARAALVGRARRGEVPRLAARPQSRPMLRRRGAARSPRPSTPTDIAGRAAAARRRKSRAPSSTDEPRSMANGRIARRRWRIAPRGKQPEEAPRAFDTTSFPRAFRRSDHAGASVRRRPRRPRRRAGAGAAAFHVCAGSTAARISFRNTCRRMSSRSAPTTVDARTWHEAPRDAMIVVMTHSHPLDFDITLAALRRDAASISSA